MSQEKKNVCAICLENVCEKSVKRLPCCHSFHQTCIDKWLEKKPSCPTCRHNPFTVFDGRPEAIWRSTQPGREPISYNDSFTLLNFMRAWMESADPIEAEVYEYDDAEGMSNYYASEQSHINITFDPSQIEDNLRSAVGDGNTQ